MNAHSTSANTTIPPKKFLERLRDELRVRHYARRTEKSYVDWARRFILFHGKRHPQDMGAVEVRAFLESLVLERHVAIATQKQARRFRLT